MGETTNEVKSVHSYSASATGSASGTSTLPQKDDDSSDTHEATQIRSGIEQTRSDLSDTIGALQEKLDPTRIAEQVKEQIKEKATEAYDTAKTAVKEATLGKAGKIMSSVSDSVTDAGAAVRDSSFVQYIRDNPIPFALLGIGIGMLTMTKKKQAMYVPASNYEPNPYRLAQDSDVTGASPSLTDRARGAAEGVAEKARGAAGSVAESARGAADRASSAVTSAVGSVRDAAGTAADTTRRQFNYVSDQARQGAQTATTQFQSTLQDNPMALGIAALAVGAIVGLSLPSTDVEGEYMGEARDRLVGQAKSFAQDAAQKVQRVTEEAGHTFKDAAQKEGLMGGQAEQKPA